MNAPRWYAALLACFAACAEVHPSPAPLSDDSIDSETKAPARDKPLAAAPSADNPGRALRQLRKQLSRSTEDLQIEHRPDGASQVLLQGRFHSASVVFRDASGARRQLCIDSPAAADEIFGAAP